MPSLAHLSLSRHIAQAPFSLSIMKQLALLGILVWCLTPFANAQITVTNAVFPVVGDTLHYAFGNQPGAINQIFTPPGGNQQWDLSNLQPTQFWNQIMRSPQTGLHNARFPGASFWFYPPNSNDEVYWQVTGSQVLDMGYFGLDKLGLGLNLFFDRVPDLEHSWAPINFFDIHQSASNVLTAFDAPIAPPILLNLVPTADSFRIRVTYQRISSIDAYGTMTIPGGAFDVLRRKQTEYKSMAVDVKVAPLGWIDISTIGGQQLLPLGTDTVTTFHFLNDVSKEAIAICTLNTAQNTVTGVQYKVVSPATATESPLSFGQLETYPNPAQNALFVRFPGDETDSDVQLILINAEGKQVLVQQIPSGTIERDLHIPVSHLASGVYTLVLQGKGVVLGRGRVVKG